MASSDEEGEIYPDFVADYEFVDGRDQPISLSSVPLCSIGDLDVADGSIERVYLHGTTIDGLEQIYKQIVAWKYNLSSPKVEVFVLCKGNHWIQLLKPRRRFEVIIRSILVTVHLLHFVKTNPPSPRERIWNHLSRTFSSYDVQPCEGDIRDHIGLVRDAFKSDMVLQESEYMCKLLEEQPRKRKSVGNITLDIQPVRKPSFVVNDAEAVDSLNLLKVEDPKEEVENLMDIQPVKKSSFMVNEAEAIDSLNLLEVKDPKEEVEDLMHIQPVKTSSFVVNEAEATDSLDLLKVEDPEEEDPEEEDPEEEDPEEEDPEEDPEEEVEDISPLDSSKGKEELKEAKDLDFCDVSQEEEELGEGEEDDEGQDEYEDYEEEAEEEELQLFDTCCAFCDNGGDILCCEGPCMRSFHPTLASGDYSCRSLCFSQAQVDGMPVFFCKNCQHKKHQCSVCGKLGSSDKYSGAEVFCCVSATCGRFYHAQCVAKALYPDNTAQAKQIEAQVAGGDALTCPAHKCVVCGRGEDRNVHALQFAICRRCPKAYHRKCLPRDISFGNDEKNVLQRAWDGLLPKRILIYCLDHEINPDLGTPARTHIVFPDTFKKEKLVTFGSAKWIYENRGERIAKSIRLERSSDKKLSQISNVGEVAGSLKIKKEAEGVKSVKNVGKDMASSGFNYLRKSHFVEGSSKSSASLGKMKIQNKEARHSSISDGRIPALKFKKMERTTAMVKPFMMENSHAGDIEQSEIERRINSLIEEVNSSFSTSDIKCHQKTVSSYTGSRENLEKSITMGKVEAGVKAVHTALEKLDGGCVIEDAVDICGPEMLDQLAKWKQKLQLYLGPFLHGKRYTSYGRHFTKPEKLQVIVDRLHWYVQDGDMIVDFSCGSNDFSCMMKEKLESVGKNCFFKNYDLHQAKNDFNFEKRNWFSVQKEELLDGSKLIIGLNPPFGFNAKLANQFIDRALKFKPKLLILIVPRETQRLDQKRWRYDLIWEDKDLLDGMSFYLPGSIDVNNKQLEQWNLVSPPLSLWSRSDWSQKHREISMTHNHLPRETEFIHLEQQVQQPVMSNYLMEESHDCYGDFSSLRNQHTDIFGVLDDIPEVRDGYQFGNHMLGTQAQFVSFNSSEVLPSFPHGDYFLDQKPM